MLNDRRQFGAYCQERGYRRGVEVGTDRADFAHNVLRLWPSCEEFWCFDPYEPYGAGSHDHAYDRTPDLMMACVRLAPFVPAVRIIRQCSRAWSKQLWFRPDFVYVDGLHDFASVAADIDAWWPYVAPGGTLAGHDYAESTPDVIRAVDALVKREGLPLNLTAEPRFPRSWWVVKP
jgi:hypothetical protein